MRRPRLTLLAPVLTSTVLALAAPVALVAPAAAGETGGRSTGAPSATGRPTRIPLPDGFQPEGIATRGGPIAYLGSRVDGDIYAADLRTGEGRVISQGPGTPSVGMKLDGRGRLFVAGGGAGNARVVDVQTGAVLARWRFATSPTFVNDVVLTPRMAWFTDSRNPYLYGVPIATDGSLGRLSDVTRLRLRGDWQQIPDAFNANGIARTPDKTGLILVNSTSGALFRVDPRTGQADQIDLGGATVTFGDGLLRDDKTLFVVQNRYNLVTKVQLNFHATAGRVAGSATSADFDIPTTVAGYGGWLYLPNARFSTSPTPTTRYWITAIRRF